MGFLETLVLMVVSSWVYTRNLTYRHKVNSQIDHDASPITANQPASPSTEVKSEPLTRGTFDNATTRNDALTWQLVQAQLL